MIRSVLGCVLLTAWLTGSAVAGEANSPKLTKETRDAAQITQENIVKMKLKRFQPQTPPMPILPMAPPPPAPPVN